MGWDHISTVWKCYNKDKENNVTCSTFKERVENNVRMSNNNQNNNMSSNCRNINDDVDNSNVKDEVHLEQLCRTSG